MLDMIKYVNKLNEQLEITEVSFTEIIIAKKIIDYCNNNDIKLTNEMLQQKISNISDFINSDDEVDKYDELIYLYFKNID